MGPGFPVTASDVEDLKSFDCGKSLSGVGISKSGGKDETDVVIMLGAWVYRGRVDGFREPSARTGFVVFGLRAEAKNQSFQMRRVEMNG